MIINCPLLAVESEGIIPQKVDIHLRRLLLSEDVSLYLKTKA